MSTELAWFKSSHSDTEGGACVEVASCPSTIHIRDSKNPTGRIVSVPSAQWTAFIRYAAPTRPA